MPFRAIVLEMVAVEAYWFVIDVLQPGTPARHSALLSRLSSVSIQIPRRIQASSLVLEMLDP